MNVVDLRRLRRGLELGVGRVGLGDAQIVGDGAVEEIGVLRHERHLRAQIGEAHVAQLDAADADAALRRIEEAQQQRHHRRLARARRPHQRHALMLADRKRDTMSSAGLSAPS